MSQQATAIFVTSSAAWTGKTTIISHGVLLLVRWILRRRLLTEAPALLLLMTRSVPSASCKHPRRIRSPPRPIRQTKYIQNYSEPDLDSTRTKKGGTQLLKTIFFLIIRSTFTTDYDFILFQFFFLLKSSQKYSSIIDLSTKIGNIYLEKHKKKRKKNTFNTLWRTVETIFISSGSDDWLKIAFFRTSVTLLVLFLFGLISEWSITADANVSRSSKFSKLVRRASRKFSKIAQGENKNCFWDYSKQADMLILKIRKKKFDFWSWCNHRVVSSVLQSCFLKSGRGLCKIKYTCCDLYILFCFKYFCLYS